MYLLHPIMALIHHNSPTASDRCETQFYFCIGTHRRGQWSPHGVVSRWHVHSLHSRSGWEAGDMQTCRVTPAGTIRKLFKKIKKLACQSTCNQRVWHNSLNRIAAPMHLDCTHIFFPGKAAFFCFFLVCLLSLTKINKKSDEAPVLKWKK